MARKPVRWEWSYKLTTDTDYILFSNEQDTSHFVFPAAGEYDIKRVIVYEDATTEEDVQQVYVEVTAPTVAAETAPIVNAFCVATGKDSKGNITAASVSRMGGPSFPVNFRNMQPINITDSNGYRRHIGFDSKTRKMYELITDHGEGRPLVWKDKVNADGTGGEDYYAYLLTRGAVGTLQRYFVEPLSANLYTKPVGKERRQNFVVDSKTFYPADARVSVSVFADNKEEPVIETQPLTVPRHEIGYDKRIIGNVIQLGIRFDGMPIIISGLTENLIAKDNLDGPHYGRQGETDIQEELSAVRFWITRGGNGINMSDGSILSGTYTQFAEIGPDGYTMSAFVADQEFTIDGNDFDNMSFYYWIPDSDTVPVGHTVVGMAPGWTMVKAVGDLLTLPAGTYFDVRAYAENAFYDQEAAEKYLADDVSQSNGVNTLPSWV